MWQGSLDGCHVEEALADTTSVQCQLVTVPSGAQKNPDWASTKPNLMPSAHICLNLALTRSNYFELSQSSYSS